MYKNLQQCKETLDGVQSIDYFLARQLYQSIGKTDDSLLFHSIMATSEALRNGHSCLKIDSEANKIGWFNNEENKPGYLFPAAEHWHKSLLSSNISSDEHHPLVYDYKRLYLRRYWQFEQELAAIIRSLLKKKVNFDIIEQVKIVNQLFPLNSDSSNSHELDWQKVAVANALLRNFSIIAGGPGTGKTFTVTKLLAALQALSENKLKIAMVAPTGKAAQRLNESIQKAKSLLQKQQLISVETLQSIPDTASTLHRLLGVRTASHNFRYNQDNHLPFNLLLVDEISMIDLPLMTRMLRAINDDCRVIMLGDADQLPSVAAGSVLADIAPSHSPGYSILTCHKLSQLTGFDIPVAEPAYDHLTVLQKSHRFDSLGEIAQLSRQVINGNSEPAWDLLQQGEKQISVVKNQSLYHFIDQLIEQYYVPLLSPSLTISQAFDYLNKFRFLVVTRSGEHGFNFINQYIEDYLSKKGLINRCGEFYAGRPIMVTKNHYQAGLFNGDIGLLWLKKDGLNKQKELFAAFPQINQRYESEQSDCIRWLSLGRLPEVETVYAMTIHKTQGSEFAHVALILPTQDSPILSRELLYTGITRASQKLSLCADKSIWELAVKRKVQRYSGLKQRIFD
jgi:exodeoxyribonuclease V alpha subunit